MIKRSSSQTGSAHIVIIIVLVIALLGELGFVAWRTMSDRAAESARKEEAKVVKYRTYKNDTHGFSFEYPSTWWVSASSMGSEEPYAYDIITIETESGKAISLETGVQKSGSECGSMYGDEVTPPVQYTVMDVVPTDLPSRSGPVSLSFMRLPKEEWEELYSFQYGLTSEYTQLKDYSACWETFQHIYEPRIDKVDTDFNTNQTLSFKGFKEFKTKDEATKFIASDEYAAIKKMMLSLKY
jgi:hypothetical protein